MTVSEVLTKGKKLLENKQIDNAANEARWIFESVFNCKSDFVFFHGDEIADINSVNKFFESLNQRAGGMPLQYVIGSWDFYGESFKVGKGVLIPRPETELLVDFALDYLKNKTSPVIYDLCAGSGCIGLTIAKKRPDSTVWLLEKSKEAFTYLNENKNKLGCVNAKTVLGDVFGGAAAFDAPKPDLILSNPPYIKSDELQFLQSEVLLEPLTALDGGIDGLDFYRAIAEKWIKKFGCAVAVECGEGQFQKIAKIFFDVCASTRFITDFNAIERVVIGTERNK